LAHLNTSTYNLLFGELFLPFGVDFANESCAKLVFSPVVCPISSVNFTV
jgi:hypothetical protein